MNTSTKKHWQTVIFLFQKLFKIEHFFFNLFHYGILIVVKKKKELFLTNH
jgi:hypothetical protein